MNEVTVELNILKDLVKESVKEAIKEERLNLSYALIPKVSNEEMKEIDSICGKPSDYNPDEFDDITDWFKK